MSFVRDKMHNWNAEHGRLKRIAKGMRYHLLEGIQTVPTNTYDVIKLLKEHDNTREWYLPTHLDPYVVALDSTQNERVRLCFHAPPQHNKTVTTLASICYHAMTAKNFTIAYITYSGTRSYDVQRLQLVPMMEKLGIEHTVRADKILVRGGAAQGGVTIIFTSTSGKLTGYTIDVAFLDDPIKDLVDANSKRKRDQIWGFIENAILTRSFGAKGSSVIVLQTRWHEDDPIGRLIKTGWKYIRIPAICDSMDDPIGRKIGEPLLPKHQPLDFLEEHKRNLMKWQCLFQGNPQPSGGYPFREYEEYEELPQVPLTTYYGLDSAYTAGAGDWSVMVRILYDHNTGNAYIDRAIRAQKKFIDFIHDIENFYKEKPGNVFWYVGGQEGSISELTTNEITKRIPHFKITHIPAASVGDKYQRSIPAQEAWNSGRLFVPSHRNQFTDDFINAICSWTSGRNEQDDDVDALGAAYHPIALPKKEVPTYRGNDFVKERGIKRRFV